MKVALGHVEQYYGKFGKLRSGVPEALTSVQAQLQQAEDEIMHSERMRKLTADIASIRQGAHLFLEAQGTKDFTQDQLLDWAKKAQKTFTGNTYEHFKTLNRHLGGDSRDVEHYRGEVDDMIGDNRRRITRALRLRKDDLEAKVKKLMVKFFGEGSKRMRDKTRGHKRIDGIWDAIEDAAKANTTQGINDVFAKWDAAVRESDAGLRSLGRDLATFEPNMTGWHTNVTWRLGNLTDSIINFKLLNFNFTSVSNISRQQWRDVKALQVEILKRQASY